MGSLVRNRPKLDPLHPHGKSGTGSISIGSASMDRTTNGGGFGAFLQNDST